MIATYLIGGVNVWPSEQEWSCHVNKTVDVVVQIGHHVVETEGRGDDAVDHHVLLLGDDSVQTLALDRLHCGHLLHARHCHDAVPDEYFRSESKGQCCTTDACR